MMQRKQLKFDVLITYKQPCLVLRFRFILHGTESSKRSIDMKQRQVEPEEPSLALLLNFRHEEQVRA